MDSVARFVVQQNRSVFRATDEELFKCLPEQLVKIIVLDEWHHRDFGYDPKPPLTDHVLKEMFYANEEWLQKQGTNIKKFTEKIRKYEKWNEEVNKEHWKKTRPSLLETWKMVAKVLTTKNTSWYRPTTEPYTHWKNYPYSGWY